MASKAKAKPQIAPIYAISGEDGYLANKRCQELLDGLLEPDERMMALFQPAEDEMAGLNVTEVLDELRTLPLMAKRRVVLLKNADSFLKSNREALEKYLESPSPSGVLILQLKNIDNRWKFIKKIAELDGLIDAGPMKAYQLPKFAADLCRSEFDKSLDTRAAGLLVELVGDQTGRIRQEIEKLSVYVGQRKSITAKDVHELVGRSKADNAFEVIDAIFEKKPEKIFQRLRNMFGHDSSTEFTVIGAFGYHFRRLFQAKALLEQGTAMKQAAREAGVPPFLQQRFFAQLQQFTLPQLGKILLRLGEMDYQIKTGQTTAPSAMERLIVQIVSGSL